LVVDDVGQDVLEILALVAVARLGEDELPMKPVAFLGNVVVIPAALVLDAIAAGQLLLARYPQDGNRILHLGAALLYRRAGGNALAFLTLLTHPHPSSRVSCGFRRRRRERWFRRRPSPRLR